MKKAALALPIILTFVFCTSNFNTFALNTEVSDSSTYSIQFEKLAGTEDANEFNSHRSELLSYFNDIIGKEQNLNPLKKSQLDFNKEDFIQGVKMHGEYTNYQSNAEYDDVMEQLNKTDYYWKISIKTSKTAIYAAIKHCSDDKCNGFHFGNNWCINRCVASRASGKVGSSKVSAVNVYALYDSAEENLQKFIKADKDDEIKVVYANIGQLGTEYHNYIDGGIVFVNGVAKYIYAFGFNLHYDKMNDKISDRTFEQMERNMDKMYLNTIHSVYGCTHIKRLYNYNVVMSMIRVYEKYALYEY